ncbi:chromosome segregation protein SMC [Haloarcula mannanilytica]|uniref:Chromosome segregation protein SMC n=1 Tax=Haloarcula mannanilytica TaxID=2509225 RepID=A0A4C2EL09_9EURY|nr:archaea-specific SMC-related protein [Haloarcula mannanilytica]GCF15085.1 chromosome segregation protein SMC [Haloarcula mannanilytica]
MTWTLEIKRIAGILDGSSTLEPGVNIVRGSNWQGKSSFIEAIKAALGVSTELTEGADSGTVHLETPSGVYDVTLTRENGVVSQQGQPYLTDEYDVIRAGLFACLDERNAVRRAVRAGENLEDVLLRPLDFQNIDAQIETLQREREQIETELSQAREAKKRLPTVQEKVTRLETEIEELQAKRETIDNQTSSADSSESVRRQLSQARSEQNQARNRIDRLEQSIERTEQRLSERRADLDALEIPEYTDIEERLADARENLSQVERDVEVLQSVYSATEMVLSENRLDLLTDVERDIDGDTVACWTCGSETTRADVADQLNALGDELTARRAQKETYRDTVEELETQREEISQARRRKGDLEEEIADLEATLADREQSLEAARNRLEQAQAEVERLSDRVDETVAELSDVESEIKYREAELEETADELAQLETRAARVEALESDLESVRDDLTELRSRKDRTKREAREAFDAAMQDILARFGTGFETARLTPEFDIVVARDGQEASLDALSEGELELIGFVAALAGRQSFDVDETAPLMLVDGLGGLDDDNLHTLIEYLQQGTEYLVFTAYPEYTAFDGHEIDPTEWHVANEKQASAD